MLQTLREQLNDVQKSSIKLICCLSAVNKSASDAIVELDNADLLTDPVYLAANMAGYTGELAKAFCCTGSDLQYFVDSMERFFKTVGTFEEGDF